MDFKPLVPNSPTRPSEINLGSARFYEASLPFHSTNHPN
jgi:hypothetical protein